MKYEINTNETIADIIREMRNNPFSWSMPSEIPGVEKCNCEAEKLADRIEAAAKRERALSADDQFAPHYEAPAKFDEAAFDEAVRGLNGWSDVADPVAEIRRMRDGTPSSPEAVLEVLRAFHDAHYSVFPRDELTERLCNAYYDQFVADAPVGNSAAMREALEAVREAFDSNDFGAMGDHPSSDVLDMADAVRRKVDAALAAPARNCDRYADWMRAWDGYLAKYPDAKQETPFEIGRFHHWLFAPAEGGAE